MLVPIDRPHVYFVDVVKCVSVTSGVIVTSRNQSIALKVKHFTLVEMLRYA